MGAIRSATRADAARRCLACSTDVVDVAGGIYLCPKCDACPDCQTPVAYRYTTECCNGLLCDECAGEHA